MRGIKGLCIIFLMLAWKGVQARDNQGNVRILPEPSLSFGLIVHYKSRTTRPDLNILHQQARFIRKGGLMKWDADWVVPKTGTPFLSGVEVRRYCAIYEKSSLISFCQPNRQLVPVSRYHRKGSTTSRPRAVGNESCNLLEDEERGEHLLEGDLTPYWAQHQIGADLVPKLLEDFKSRKPASVSIYDTGFMVQNLKCEMTPGLVKALRNPKSFFDTYKEYPSSDDFDHSHGDRVANLINSAKSKHPVGVGFLAQVVSLTSTLHETDLAKIPLQNGAKLANFSLGWGNDEFTAEGAKSLNPGATFAEKVFNSLSAGGTIVVKAAGNSYPEELEEVIKSGGIVVGSSTPEGFSSSFSQEGHEVTILAPSDTLIQSLSKDDSVELFYGTSGATALVTGALAAPAALLEGITIDEARALLKLSAIPHFNSHETPQKNGAGILNQFRMAMVTKNLTEKWPGNRDQLLQKETYDFSALAGQLKERAQGLLRIGECRKQKEGFALLRQSFFLNPSDVETIKQLGTIYRSLERPRNAAFFENMLFDGGLERLKEWPSDKIKAFISGTVDNSKIRAKVMDFALASPITKSVFVEAILTKAGRENEELILEIEKLATGRGVSPSQQENFLETVFTSEASQRAASNVGSYKLKRAISQEWAKRQFPKIESSLLTALEKHRDPVIRQIWQDYLKHGNPKP